MADWHSGGKGCPMSATPKGSTSFLPSWLQSPQWGSEVLHWLPQPLQLTSGRSALTPLLDRASVWHHTACL